MSSTEWEVIHEYTDDQAVEDGILARIEHLGLRLIKAKEATDKNMPRHGIVTLATANFMEWLNRVVDRVPLGHIKDDEVRERHAEWIFAHELHRATMLAGLTPDNPDGLLLTVRMPSGEIARAVEHAGEDDPTRVVWFKANEVGYTIMLPEDN